MKRIYIAPLVFILFLFGIFSYFFLAYPNKIVGGNVGSYPKGTVTLSISKRIYSMFGGTINKGQLVIFDPIPLSGASVVSTWVGIVEENAGQTNSKLKTLENEWSYGEIPEGSLGVKTNNNNDYLLIVPVTKINKIVWYPKPQQ
jgi:hypothetical protein